MALPLFCGPHSLNESTIATKIHVNGKSVASICCVNYLYDLFRCKYIVYFVIIGQKVSSHIPEKFSSEYTYMFLLDTCLPQSIEKFIVAW